MKAIFIKEIALIKLNKIIKYLFNDKYEKIYFYNHNYEIMEINFIIYI